MITTTINNKTPEGRLHQALSAALTARAPPRRATRGRGAERTDRQATKKVPLPGRQQHRPAASAAATASAAAAPTSGRRSEHPYRDPTG